MNNQAINQNFLAAIDVQTRTDILGAVAKHYGITPTEALEEVTHEDAEHLLDYLTGPVRSAASITMRRHGFSN